MWSLEWKILNKWHLNSLDYPRMLRNLNFCRDLDWGSPSWHFKKTDILTVKKKSREFEKGHLDLSNHLNLDCSQLSRSPGLTNCHLQIVNKTIIPKNLFMHRKLVYVITWMENIGHGTFSDELLSLVTLDCINHSNNQWSH